MAIYRTKPVLKQAVQFFYDKPEIEGVFYPPTSEDGKTYIGDAYVVTVHGQPVYLANGDFIIPEPDGEHYYPCKADIFLARHELVED